MASKACSTIRGAIEAAVSGAKEIGQGLKEALGRGRRPPGWPSSVQGRRLCPKSKSTAFRLPPEIQALEDESAQEPGAEYATVGPKLDGLIAGHE